MLRKIWMRTKSIILMQYHLQMNQDIRMVSIASDLWRRNLQIKETRNQLRIENIYGCGTLNKEDFAEDVLVIYCALYPDAVEKETYVVGWYKHATVYRNCEVMRFPSEDEEGYYDQAYNAIARKEDCVLLPRASRRKANIWKVPRKSKGVAYGFGQSNVWFAQGREENKLLDQFLNRIVKQIEEYSGKNWLDECAE